MLAERKALAVEGVMESPSGGSRPSSRRRVVAALTRKACGLMLREDASSRSCLSYARERPRRGWPGIEEATRLPRGVDRVRLLRGAAGRRVATCALELGVDVGDLTPQYT